MKKERSFSVGLTPGPYAGKVCIPSSKSVAHRLLICAALGTEKTTLLIDGFSRDILATAKCLRALGAGIETNGRRIRVMPIQKPVSGGLLPCGESGSTLRFLLPVAGPTGWRFPGTEAGCISADSSTAGTIACRGMCPASTSPAC